MTKPYNVRLFDEDGPEVRRLMVADNRDGSYIIRELVHEALIARQLNKPKIAPRPLRAINEPRE